MPNTLDDIVFTFDTGPFLHAMNSIGRGFSSVKDSANKFASSTSKKYNGLFSGIKEKAKDMNSVTVSNFKEGSKSMVNALTKQMAALGTAYLGFRSMMKQIPEIGRAFQHAGNIALKSFFWPLRKMLIPMLNKMMSWVRDHRAMFVKWGATLANAFRVVVGIVKSVIKLVRTFITGFIGQFEAIFGKTTKRMGDIVNIIMFKTAALVQFLLVLLGPLFKKIGVLFAEAFAGSKSFFEGFQKGFGPVSPVIIRFINIIDRLLGSSNKTKKEMFSLLGIMKGLGTFVGGILKTTLLAVVQIIDGMAFSITSLIGAIRLAFAHLTGDQKTVAEEQKKFADRNKRFIEDYKKSAKEAAGSFSQAFSIFTTEDKKVNTKETITKLRPKDSKKSRSEKEDSAKSKPRRSKLFPVIIPEDIKKARSKKGSMEEVKKARSPKTASNEIKINTNITVGGISVAVTSTADAKRAGEEFGLGLQNKLHEGLRDSVNNAMMGVAS